MIAQFAFGTCGQGLLSANHSEGTRTQSTPLPSPQMDDSSILAQMTRRYAIGMHSHALRSQPRSLAIRVPSRAFLFRKMAVASSPVVGTVRFVSGTPKLSIGTVTSLGLAVAREVLNEYPNTFPMMDGFVAPRVVVFICGCPLHIEKPYAASRISVSREEKKIIRFE